MFSEMATVIAPPLHFVALGVTEVALLKKAEKVLGVLPAVEKECLAMTTEILAIT
jgi:hypothetical protein